MEGRRIGMNVGLILCEYILREVYGVWVFEVYIFETVFTAVETELGDELVGVYISVDVLCIRPFTRKSVFKLLVKFIL